MSDSYVQLEWQVGLCVHDTTMLIKRLYANSEAALQKLRVKVEQYVLWKVELKHANWVSSNERNVMVFSMQICVVHIISIERYCFKITASNSLKALIDLISVWIVCLLTERLRERVTLSMALVMCAALLIQ